MFESITTYITEHGSLSMMVEYVGLLLSDVKDYAQEKVNMRTLSIGMMCCASVLFFATMIIVVVKLFFFKSEKKHSKVKRSDDPQHEMFGSSDDEGDNLELEFEEEQREDIERLRISIDKDDRVHEQLRLRENEEAELEKQKNKKKPEIALDWEKGKIIDKMPIDSNIQIPKPEYQQSGKDLNDLVGLIIDMIARGVEDLKIAQTIMFRSQGRASEDDVMQIIDSIKGFIRLCNSKKFAILKNIDNLPNEKDALLRWADGDVSWVMILLQALIDERINKSATVGIGPKRDALFKEASDIALNFGAIAIMEDTNLAINALELSIELNPQNVWSWNKVADAYYKLGNQKKAKWAYERVLESAEESAHMRQIANASKALALMYKGDKAEMFYKMSKDYYDGIGINRRLDNKEIEIVHLIESKQKAEIANIVGRVLEI